MPLTIITFFSPLCLHHTPCIATLHSLRLLFDYTASLVEASNKLAIVQIEECDRLIRPQRRVSLHAPPCPLSLSPCQHMPLTIITFFSPLCLHHTPCIATLHSLRLLFDYTASLVEASNKLAIVQIEECDRLISPQRRVSLHAPPCPLSLSPCQHMPRTIITSFPPYR